VSRRFCIVALALLAGCGLFKSRPPDGPIIAPESMQLLAVLPIEPATPPGGGTEPSDDDALAVTAQVYRVLADQTEFRFVADLAVSDVLKTPQVRGAGSVVDRAVALGKEVGADGVIYGRVFRFQKRVGTEFGASVPASVWFELGLVQVSSGQVVWTGRFDQTQQALASNFLNWWMFWEAGPRWVSASQLAGMGVDRLFGEMTARVNAEG
jgi:hypothetical protein